ncbi:hypothetical protein, partial [Propylenella binzhouense]
MRLLLYVLLAIGILAGAAALIGPRPPGETPAHADALPAWKQAALPDSDTGVRNVTPAGITAPPSAARPPR